MNADCHRRHAWDDLSTAVPRVRSVGDWVDIFVDGVVRAEIVAPPGDAGEAAARLVAERLAASAGTTVRTVTAGWPAAESGAAESGAGDGRRVEILLGNALNNARIATLYHLHLCPVDGVFPGPGGHFLRTLRDPWGDGTDYVIAGASADAELVDAARRLADEFRHRDGDVVVPHLHESRISSAFREAYPSVAFDPDDPSYADIVALAREAYETRTHRGMTPYLSHGAFMFALTGHPGFAHLYVELFRDQYDALLAYEPDHWGRWGFDADFQAVGMIAGWHGIADSPLFTPEDRGRITSLLVDYLGNSEEHWHRHRADVPFGRPGSVRHNHFTFAALGLLFGALTLGRCHKLDATERWLEMADECFAPQLTAVKSAEDCDAYSWLALSHTLRYALVRPFPAYFDDGTCAAVLERGIATMDNLGCQVPHGDASAHRGNFAELNYWRPAARVLGDPLYAQLVAKKEALAPTYAPYGIEPIGYRYSPAPDPTATHTDPPERRIGVSVQPLDPAYCANYSDVPPTNGFDKISIRDSFSSREPYVLIDGVGNGSHGHRDANAIIRFTSRDRIWLEDADYDKVSANFHNTVLVSRDGLTTRHPAYAELDEVVDADHFVLTATTLRGLAGADWTRTTIHIREVGLVVVDRITATEPGTYEITSLWRTVGANALEERAWRIDMPPETLRIYTLPPAGPWRREVLPERYVRADWSEYPFAQPDVSVLRQSTTRRLARTESLSIAHFLIDHDVQIDAQPDSTGGLRARIGSDLVTFDPTREGADLLRVEEGGAAGLPGPPPASAPAVSPRKHAAPAWTVAVGDARVIAVASNDLGDTETLLVGTAGSIEAYAGDRLAWTAPTAAPVTALAGDRDSIIAGGEDGYLEVFDGTGSPRWRREFRPHMGHPAVARTVLTARLDPDEPPAVVLATESCHVHAYSANGDPLWRYEVVHAATHAIAADLDGDGRDEILSATEYWQWHCVGPTGSPLFRVRGVEGSGADVVATCRSGDNAGERLSLFGGWDGHLSAYGLDGSAVWDVALGDTITACLPVAADTGEDVLVASLSGYVHRLGADGSQRWYRRLEGAVTHLSWLPSVRLLVASCGDTLLWLDEWGDLVADASLGARVTGLRPYRYAGADGVCVRDGTGRVHWFPTPR